VSGYDYYRRFSQLPAKIETTLPRAS
jgi:hypothetical protein